MVTAGMRSRECSRRRRGLLGDPDPDQAANAVAGHLRRFWEPRMRDQIVAHQAKGGAGLSDLARKAVAQLAAEKADEADA